MAGRRRRKALTRSQIMARVRRSGTEPELLLRRKLWSMGRRYRLRMKLPGSPDLVFVSARLAVFVDGCFWHGCPVHHTLPAANRGFWLRKVTRNQERDRRVDEELAALGWRVLRIWEHEVREAGALQAAASRVAESLPVRSSAAP